MSYEDTLRAVRQLSTGARTHSPNFVTIKARLDARQERKPAVARPAVSVQPWDVSYKEDISSTFNVLESEDKEAARVVAGPAAWQTTEASAQTSVADVEDCT